MCLIVFVLCVFFRLEWLLPTSPGTSLFFLTWEMYDCAFCFLMLHPKKHSLVCMNTHLEKFGFGNGSNSQDVPSPIHRYDTKTSHGEISMELFQLRVQ